jgi:thiol-disulfide isomerase/thioredoxin
VMGSWCSDSQREVPRFIKIMDSIGYNINTLTLINVDTKKQAENTSVSQLKIERIPTFIFTKDGKEIGRIVESPHERLENDMLKIIGG